MGLTSLQNIPVIMTSKQWHRGATLMKRWFAAPPTAKPLYVSPDVTTITMQWLLSFRAPSFMFDVMKQQRVWSNDAAKKEVAAVLRRKHVVNGKFDFSSYNVLQQHDIHVNSRRVKPGPPMSDLHAALANFALYVCPLVGEVKPDGHRIRVTLSKVGFHAADSYDFEGDQDLGYWDEKRNLAGYAAFPNGQFVENKSFREWRRQHGRGGDFAVYSDVKVVTLDPPDSFHVSR